MFAKNEWPCLVLLCNMGRPYMITTNVDVSDGLANGAIGNLEFVEYFNNSLPDDEQQSQHTENNVQENQKVKRLWLRFQGNTKTGQKARRVYARYVQKHKIAENLVPIARRNSTTYLNNNRTISARRNHFPIIPACSITIHKSQGGTFDKVVYAYDKCHDQQLVYVALSRVTSISGLFLTAPSNNRTFHHGRSIPRALHHLQSELTRLAANPLRTEQELVMEFLRDSQLASFMIFNCQSLRAHNADLTDAVTQECMFLMLTETWLRNDEPIQIPNFDCCVQFKREHQRAGVVAIYKKINSACTTTPDRAIHFSQTSDLLNSKKFIGDICAVECLFPNGQIVLAIAVYISNNQQVEAIIKFLNFVLLPYTLEGSKVLGEEYCNVPIILGGDFNINFASAHAEPLITFLREQLHLEMTTDRNSPTTSYKTVIDAVFSRNLALHSKLFVSYFSYHRPIIACIKNNL